MKKTKTQEMTPTHAQAAEFLKRRKILVGSWRSIAPVLVAGILIFYFTMLYAAPILVSPFAAMQRLEENSVDMTTLQTMAVMLPLIVTVLCLVLLIVIANGYRRARIERQYQELLENLLDQDSGK